MSKAEILAELPKLKAEERSEVFAWLCELQEADVLRGGNPTPEEKQALDEALADFDRDRDPGASWREVLQRARGPGRT